eukprot:m.165887 g.165887  ORF g.165887 m.165887 type:complete len:60 (+) comp14437_c0_seq3:142-321(+)
MKGEVERVCVCVNMECECGVYGQECNEAQTQLTQIATCGAKEAIVSVIRTQAFWSQGEE